MRTVAALVLLTACGSAEPVVVPLQEPAPADATQEAFTPSAEQRALLERADAADGTVDHTISQCAVCGLGMPGDPAHAVQTGEYEVHLCSETCKAHYEAHTGEAIDNLARVLD